MVLQKAEKSCKINKKYSNKQIHTRAYAHNNKVRYIFLKNWYFFLCGIIHHLNSILCKVVFYANKVTASTQNDTRWARITRGVAASTKLDAGTKGNTADHRRAQNSQRGRKHHFSHSAPLLGVFVRYSRSIRGIYVCIGYVSGMYRVCIGYLSEKYRKLEGRNKKQ